jgi:hypothetical protein
VLAVIGVSCIAEKGRRDRANGKRGRYRLRPGAATDYLT